LKALTIEEKVSGNLVHLETRRSIPAGRASLEVHYHVLVPPSAEVNVVTTNGAVSVGSLTGAVRASSTNGSVTGASLSGKVDFTTVNGSIHVDLSGVAAAGISLKSVNGSVELKVPQQARASVSAKCVNGRVAVTGLPVAAAEQRRQRAFQAQLNGGGPSIEVETTNGVVRIDGKS
jgi:DUF4097 and DUF4098 domain-containing protein YvlB